MNTELLLELSKKKAFTIVKTRFLLHGYINSDGTTQIIFSVTVAGLRKRLPTGYFVSRENWDTKRCRHKNDEELNLILDNMESKATQVKTFYFLTKRQLCLESFLHEFLSETPSYDFNSFMINEILKQCQNKNTLKKHKSIHKKLKEYKEVLPFTQVTLKFIDEYRIHLHKIGNNKTTINSNIKIIKHYLKTAVKHGVLLNIDLDDVKPGSCSGNRTSVAISDVKKLYAYYFSEFIKPNYKLSLGYWLVAYNTGMRISDLQNLRRNKLSGTIHFKTVKTQKDQAMKLNKRAQEVINEDPRLFVEFKVQQKINEDLKKIASMCGISKKLTLHVARHTFATNYLKLGGQIHDLQTLLGHSRIETTMVYVHLDVEDALDSVHLLDQV